ncbi:MAG: branched-chain amino acid ABC transporter permease [Acidimicrobiales bacterium]
MSFLRELLTDPMGFYRAHQLLVAQCGVNALLGISIWVTLYSGQLTLANVGFMAIGGYTSVILAIHLHTPLAVNVAAGALLAGGVGVVIGLPVLRLRGVFLAIATVGFGEAIRFGVILNLGITGKGQGLTNPGASPSGGIAAVWLSVAVLAWVCWRLTTTRMGQAWAAIREDELAASSNAVNVAGHKLAAFVLGAVLAGYAGGLDAHLNFFIDPTEYAFNRAVLVLVFAVVGGVATVIGPVVGAVLLTSLPEIIRSAAAWRDVVAGLVLIAVMVFRPQGIVGRRVSLGRPAWWPRRRARAQPPATAV